MTWSRAEQTVRTCLRKISRLEESNRDMALQISKLTVSPNPKP
jgi:hypothetical protein